MNGLCSILLHLRHLAQAHGAEQMWTEKPRDKIKPFFSLVVYCFVLSGISVPVIKIELIQLGSHRWGPDVRLQHQKENETRLVFLSSVFKHWKGDVGMLSGTSKRAHLNLPWRRLSLRRSRVPFSLTYTNWLLRPTTFKLRILPSQLPSTDCYYWR